MVDDTRENLRLLVRMLAENGYKVRPTASGSMALTAAQISPPDLVLLDIMMPGMDGFDVLKILKSQEDTKDIPVVMLTARGMGKDVVNGLELGAADYLVKPFMPEELVTRLQTVLRS